MKNYRKKEYGDVREKISLLWIMILIIMAFTDIFTFMMPGFIGDLAAGETPLKITQELMLIMAMVNTVPIGMIFLSRFLWGKANRWVNTVAGIATIAYVIGGASAYLHYYYFGGLEVLCIIIIIWLSWSGKRQEVKKGEQNEF
jgi:hypothetical protein